MEKLDNVIAGLAGCVVGNCSNCEYGDSDCHRDDLMRDALEWLKLLKDDLDGAHDEIHRLMQKGEEKEPPCAKCEYNLEMIRQHHIVYLPETCPERRRGGCPDFTVYDGIMSGLEQALAYERGEIELLTHTRSTDEEGRSDG